MPTGLLELGYSWKGSCEADHWRTVPAVSTHKTGWRWDDSFLDHADPSPASSVSAKSRLSFGWMETLHLSSRRWPWRWWTAPVRRRTASVSTWALGRGNSSCSATSESADRCIRCRQPRIPISGWSTRYPGRTQEMERLMLTGGRPRSSQRKPWENHRPWDLWKVLNCSDLFPVHHWGFSKAFSSYQSCLLFCFPRRCSVCAWRAHERLVPGWSKEFDHSDHEIGGIVVRKLWISSCKPRTRYCNRGRWPLLWPFRSCRHRSCRCSISGNYRTRSRLPHLSPESLRTQTAVRHRRFLCPFEETVASVWNCIYIFISIIKQYWIYISQRRPVDSTVPSCAVARLRHGFTCHISTAVLQSVSKDWMLTGSHASRYIASRSRQSRSFIALPLHMPVWS